MIETFGREKAVRTGLEKARAVADRLKELGHGDPDSLGELSAVLSDFYVEAEACRRLIDAFLSTPAGDRDRLNELLIDLHTGLDHIRRDLKDGVELVWDLATEIAPEDDVRD